MLLDPEFGGHAGASPEHALICAVILRAFYDLFGPAFSCSNGDNVDVTRRDALAFLTDAKGGWARRRNELCGLVELDGDKLRRLTIDVLEGRDIDPETFTGRNPFSHVENARKLWAAEALVQTMRNSRAKPSKPRNVKASYSSVRETVLPLLKEPRQFKELIVATDGDCSDHMIRKVLTNAVAKGEVIRDNERNTYVLAAA